VRRRWLALGAAVGGLARAVAADPAGAQGAPATAAAVDSLLGRALDLEGTNRPREAAGLFRRVLSAPPSLTSADARAGALLGAERAYAELAQTDSVLPLADALVRATPADPTARTVQLRALVTLRRDAEARAAYRAWRAAAPGDATPFREFTRLLLAAGQRAAADSVLRDAALLSFGRAGLSGARELAPERAQVLASAGEWAAAAGAWREALSRGGAYAGAVVFSLQSAPDSLRASVSGALLAPPAPPDARRAAATLLLGWRRPREAWAVPRGTAARQRGAQRVAGRRRPARRGPGVGRRRGTRGRAYSSRSPRVRLPTRAARPPAPPWRRATPRGARARRAHGRARVGGCGRRAGARPRPRAGPARSRGPDAERRPRGSPATRRSTPTDRATLAAAVADAWVAAGRPGARARVASAPAGRRGAQRRGGWLALYEGDPPRRAALLRRQRRERRVPARRRRARLAHRVRRCRARAPSGAGARRRLPGTRARRQRACGRGLRESARALPDAAPPLLAAAARLRLARGEAAAAEALWARVLAAHAAAPEAAEAELAWARALLARGDRAGARARLEHLIVTFAESALAPVARRELDALGPA
jgi:hypothetical protein